MAVKFAEVQRKESEVSSTGVSLLVSILVRYPEICTITYNPEAKTIGFSFIVMRRMGEDEIERLRQKMASSIAVLWDLLHLDATAGPELDVSEFGEMSQVSIARQVSNLTGEEISLITGLMLAEFGDDVMRDRGDDLEEEDLMIQDEFIENLLADVKITQQGRRLIGFREEGRVVVFNRSGGAH